MPSKILRVFEALILVRHIYILEPVALINKHRASSLLRLRLRTQMSNPVAHGIWSLQFLFFSMLTNIQQAKNHSSMADHVILVQRVLGRAESLTLSIKEPHLQGIGKVATRDLEKLLQ